MKPRSNILKTVTIVALFAIIGAHTAQAQNYFTGSGGKGIRLAVLEPAGKGLSADEHWMLSLVQGSITGDFNKYSAMTVIDRQNLEKIFAEWKESMEGHYSDADRVKIGNLTNASHILTGSISKTASAFMLELSVTDVASGERKASYSPTPVSPLALENLSALKAASADLLRQLGVELTSVAQGELKQTVNTSRIQAETMLARGIVAKRQGTEVAALSYFYQAEAFDSSLFEASKRSSVMAANISSGNIGANVRNDILWRKSWMTSLTETEETFHSIISSVDPPYTLHYSTGIETKNINYQKETADLSIPINLSANLSWFNAMNRSLKAAQAVLDGLNTTNRKNDWGLANWPWNGVTNANPFASSKYYDIRVLFELVNEQNRVISSQTVNLNPSFGITGDSKNKFTIAFTENTHTTLTFNGVRADDIGDNMTIRVASVNGAPLQNARIAINAISAAKRQQNLFWHIERGVVKGFDGSLSADQRAQYRNLVIPKEAWGEPVTAIGDGAFDNSGLTGVTIPNTVTSIGKRAFANNQLTVVTIPNGVTTIWKEAFADNRLTKVTIPNSVIAIGDRAFANNQLESVSIPNSVTSIGYQFLFGNSIVMKGAYSNTIIDARNYRTYRIVKIGNKAWMAENMNYQPQSGNSWCYDNNGSNCERYGRLYDWATAKMVCPTGWHLPSREEWGELAEAAGGTGKYGWKGKASKNLKSKFGWDKLQYDEDGNGIDLLGFSARPGGRRADWPGATLFWGIGSYGAWWTATEKREANPFYRGISNDSQWLLEHSNRISTGLSVRCVQN